MLVPKLSQLISVKESTDIDKAIETLGYPFIVKTRFGGYDGKGQVLINNEKDLQEGFKLIETSECVAEKYLNIRRTILLLQEETTIKSLFSHYKKMSIEIKYFSKQLFQRESIKQLRRKSKLIKLSNRFISLEHLQLNFL